ncbi:hypothetical protein [Halorussus salinus]|uniref:hypothetical protein n=1 Tax=Halorussus salinus TaxID=1364935 RepID=UPI001091D20A|nr:hypothetical protein [Halorussus salinus]
MSDDGGNTARTIRRVGALLVVTEVLGTILSTTGGEPYELAGIFLLLGAGSLLYLFFSFTEKRSA